MTAAAARPWPLSLSEHVMPDRLLAEASQANSKLARAAVNNHYVALAANLHLCAVWQSYINAKAGA